MRAPKRFAAAALAAVYFCVNVLAVHAAESNFWAERRKGSPSRPDSTQYHLASAATSAAAPASARERILAGLPGISPVDLAGTAPVPPGEFPAWLPKAISPYGSVKEMRIGRSARTPLIVHIQDAHGIETAQRNIANIIETVAGGWGPAAGDKTHRLESVHQPPVPHPQTPLLVGVEGAAGGFDLAPYRDFPDPAITRDIADYFLKEGFIGAPEYAGLTSARRPALWGVEDLPLYEGNIKAFRDSLPKKERANAILRDLQTRAERLKEKIYSPGLKEFDRHFTAYKDGREGLGEYVTYLTDRHAVIARRGEAGVATLPSVARDDKYPNVSLLSQALAAEARLDFKQVESERRRLVQLLVNKLSEAQTNRLVNESVRYRSGLTSYAAYYQFLKNLCRAAGIGLASYGPLNDYVEYILLADRIDRNMLLDELAALEKSVEADLAVRPEQKRLAAAARNVLLLKKLFTHAMTMTDWTAYDRDRERVLGVDQELNVLAEAAGGVPDSKNKNPLTNDFVRPFEDFCRIATLRNDAFVDNLLKAADGGSRPGPGNHQPPPAAVLVAGGFHSEGLAEIFRRKNISYMVVTPKIAEVPRDNNYLDVFARDPLPLEKIFRGEKIYLAYPLSFAGRPVAGYENVREQATKLFLGVQTVLQDAAVKSFEFMTGWVVLKRNNSNIALPKGITLKTILPIREGQIVIGEKRSLSFLRAWEHVKSRTTSFKNVILGQAWNGLLATKRIGIFLGLALFVSGCNPAAGYFSTGPSIAIIFFIVTLTALLLRQTTKLLGHPISKSNTFIVLFSLFILAIFGLPIVENYLIVVQNTFGPVLNQLIGGILVGTFDLIVNIPLALLSISVFNFRQQERHLSAAQVFLWGTGEEAVFRWILYPWLRNFFLSLLISPLLAIPAACITQALIFSFFHTIYLLIQVKAKSGHRYAVERRILARRAEFRSRDVFQLISLAIAGLLYGAAYEILGPVASLVAHQTANFAGPLALDTVGKISTVLIGRKNRSESDFQHRPPDFPNSITHAFVPVFVQLLDWIAPNRFHPFKAWLTKYRNHIGAAGLVVEIPLLTFFALTAPVGGFIAGIALFALAHGLLRAWETHRPRAGPGFGKFFLDSLAASAKSFAGFVPYGILSATAAFSLPFPIVLLAVAGAVLRHLWIDRDLFRPAGSQRNIVIVIGRFAGMDGVTLETAKAIRMLKKQGHRVFIYTGEADEGLMNSLGVDGWKIDAPAKFQKDLLRDMGVLEGGASAEWQTWAAGTDKNTEPDERMARLVRERAAPVAAGLKAYIREKEADLLFTQNLSHAWSVHLAAAVQEVQKETGIPAAHHNHDFSWQRDYWPRLAGAVKQIFRLFTPPEWSLLPWGLIPLGIQTHINAQSKFANPPAAVRQGRVFYLPNVFLWGLPEEDLPDDIKPLTTERKRELRDFLGLAENDIPILQPTRVVMRKDILASVRVTAELQKKLAARGLRPVLIVTHEKNDEGDAYANEVDALAEKLGVRILYANEPLTASETFSPWHAYQLDEAYGLYLSSGEGFGNALEELLYFRVPFIVRPYDVYQSDIWSKGIDLIEYHPADFQERRDLRGRVPEAGDEEFVAEKMAEDILHFHFRDRGRWTEKTENRIRANYEIAAREFSMTKLGEILATILRAADDLRLAAAPFLLVRTLADRLKTGTARGRLRWIFASAGLVATAGGAALLTYGTRSGLLEPFQAFLIVTAYAAAHAILNLELLQARAPSETFAWHNLAGSFILNLSLFSSYMFLFGPAPVLFLGPLAELSVFSPAFIHAAMFVLMLFPIFSLEPGSREKFMALALWEAFKARLLRPVSSWPAAGAVIVDKDGNVIGKGYNSRYLHAEERAWLDAARKILAERPESVPAEARARLRAILDLPPWEQKSGLKAMATEGEVPAILEGFSLYVTLSPCPRCRDLMIPSGARFISGAPAANTKHLWEGGSLHTGEILKWTSILLTGPLYYFLLAPYFNKFHSNLQKWELALRESGARLLDGRRDILSRPFKDPINVEFALTKPPLTENLEGDKSKLINEYLLGVEGPARPVGFDARLDVRVTGRSLSQWDQDQWRDNIDVLLGSPGFTPSQDIAIQTFEGLLGRLRETGGRDEAALFEAIMRAQHDPVFRDAAARQMGEAIKEALKSGSAEAYEHAVALAGILRAAGSSFFAEAAGGNPSREQIERDQRTDVELLVQLAGFLGIYGDIARDASALDRVFDARFDRALRNAWHMELYGGQEADSSGAELLVFNVTELIQDPNEPLDEDEQALRRLIGYTLARRNLRPEGKRAKVVFAAANGANQKIAEALGVALGGAGPLMNSPGISYEAYDAGRRIPLKALQNAHAAGSLKAFTIDEQSVDAAGVPAGAVVPLRRIAEELQKAIERLRFVSIQA